MQHFVGGTVIHVLFFNFLRKCCACTVKVRKRIQCRICRKLIAVVWRRRKEKKMMIMMMGDTLTHIFIYLYIYIQAHGGGEKTKERKMVVWIRKVAQHIELSVNVFAT
ncbi:hypothetical protein Tb10.70.4020 [Trypanosoma brucei brucei TREU927]|uniref:Uncharacterized protein n=1 Tax=Trypanosoma brucei brucei (strain 927/4 GUTat10.1) TaxID=185431 RepID=Q38BQ6_TRYB2|nr:hypothetical protein Tb10.70.4020 [Trypanosoma brucei brucei TREU927]EAN77764.1 hypothetical protein Tb10.70.4020 [Trypanosoma brucei brucei TREU927]